MGWHCVPLAMATPLPQVYNGGRRFHPGTRFNSSLPLAPQLPLAVVDGKPLTAI